MARTTRPTSMSSPSGKTYLPMKDLGPMRNPPTLEMAWLSRRPSGLSNLRMVPKYWELFEDPTCSNMPTDAIASNAPSRTSR